MKLRKYSRIEASSAEKTNRIDGLVSWMCRDWVLSVYIYISRVLDEWTLLNILQFYCWLAFKNEIIACQEIHCLEIGQ